MYAIAINENHVTSRVSGLPLSVGQNLCRCFFSCCCRVPLI